jgi:hypothetical protein
MKHQRCPSPLEVGPSGVLGRESLVALRKENDRFDESYERRNERPEEQQIEK